MSRADAVHVIDDFLPDPHALRQLGLAAEYPVLSTPTFYPGRNSAARYPLQNLDEAVARITGHAVTPMPNSSHGKFRLSFAGEAGAAGVHIDNCHWTGVLYLSPGEAAESGTDFFRHRPSNTLRAPVFAEDWDAWPFRSVERLWGEVITPHTNDPSKWELVRRVPMKFNRLVLFEPWQWHNAGAGLGDSIESGRLIYLLSYNRAEGGDGER